MSEILWVSDSDVCEMCDSLLDYFGVCPHCGWDGIDWDEQDDEYPPFEDDDEQPTIGTPEEAYAVALSLSDAEIERLSED